MNRILALQVAFDLMIYDVHRADYDPIKDIEAFWNTYSINSSADYMVAMLTYCSTEHAEKDRLLADEQIQAFAIALYRALIAYVLLQYRHLQLHSMQLSAEAKKRIDKELEMSQKIADFFSRIPR